MKKPNMVTDFNGTLKSKLDYAAFLQQDISKETVRENLTREMRDAYLLLSELLATPPLLDMIAEHYYQNFLKLKATHENQLTLESQAQEDAGK